jgi:hypothetical protein
VTFAIILARGNPDERNRYVRHPAFGTQVIGQTEKALNAILERQLAGTGLTEPQ